MGLFLLDSGESKLLIKDEIKHPHIHHIHTYKNEYFKMGPKVMVQC